MLLTHRHDLKILTLIFFVLVFNACDALDAIDKTTKRLGMETFVFPSVSMRPSIEPGDKLVTFKGPPAKIAKLGALVVFPSPTDASTTYLKRIVAVGPSTVAFSRGRLLVDGKALRTKDLGPISFDSQGTNGESMGRMAFQRFEERFGDQHWSIMQTKCNEDRACELIQAKCIEGLCVGADMPPVKLAEGQVYVLGDNRDNSMDSRHWGPISTKAIKGRASAIYVKKTGKIVRLMTKEPEE